MEASAKYLPDFSTMVNARTHFEYVRYARTKFPEISEALIKQNLCELITAHDAEYQCQSCCMGIDMCPELLNSAGYTYQMILLPSGWIKIECVPCMFNGGRVRGKCCDTAGYKR